MEPMPIADVLLWWSAHPAHQSFRHIVHPAAVVRFHGYPAFWCRGLAFSAPQAPRLPLGIDWGLRWHSWAGDLLQDAYDEDYVRRSFDSNPSPRGDDRVAAANHLKAFGIDNGGFGIRSVHDAELATPLNDGGYGQLAD